MNSQSPLSPTTRTSLTRLPTRAALDRHELHEFLEQALYAHVGVIVEGDGGVQHPVVLPAAYGVDLQGPDEEGTLYVHGSVAAGWLGSAAGREVCVTITELDGLVAGRSAFAHSMNYRSAVVIGRARLVEDLTEREAALAAIVDHMIPGRWDTLRPSNRKELAATAVLAVPLAETSMKRRTGGPADEPTDVEAGIWGGHIPLSRTAGAPVSAEDSHDHLPQDVARRAAEFSVDRG